MADLNGDGRPDIAFYGDGKDLEVIYNEGTNGWSDPKRWHIDDGSMDVNALVEGDFERRRPAWARFTPGTTAIFVPWHKKIRQHVGRSKEDPLFRHTQGHYKLPILPATAKKICYRDWDNTTPFRFPSAKTRRSASPPPIYFGSQAIRSYCADTLDGGKKSYIVTIAENSGRAQRFQSL